MSTEAGEKTQAPGGDRNADRLAALSPAKRALLELEIRKKVARGASGTTITTIPLRPNEDRAPLSFSQLRLWFLSQLEPDSVAYNEPKALRLHGRLDVQALQWALNQILARHLVLGSTLELGDDGPEQRIHAGREIVLHTLDLRTSPEATREAEAGRILTEVIRQPYRLNTDLMLRASLLRLADEEHILLLVTHHIASDGWSMGILMRELSSLYQSHLSARPADLPELPVQYADYAQWQHERLKDGALDASVAYWKKQLAGLSALDLPLDHPRARLQTRASAAEARRLPKDVCLALERLSRQEGATLFMTLLAALQVLLHRYTAQDDIAVGSPIAGRTEPEFEGLIGFFVNMLVLRTDLSGDPSFRQLLQRVKEVAWSAFQHQDVPFERLVAELQPKRIEGRNPLFDVTLAFQNVPKGAFELPGITTTPLEVSNGTPKFDLGWMLVEDGESIRGRLEYRAELFDAATIRRLWDSFEMLLRGVVAAPDAPISTLALLPAAALQQLLVEWNQTRTVYPEARVHELFEAQVARSPDAVAVVCDDEALSYGELNRRANQVAHHLRALEQDGSPLVGVCMDRSPQMVVAVLAILKIGRAYLPLDPDYPTERLAYMLRDSQVSVVLTTAAFMPRVTPHGVRVICLDGDEDRAAMARHPSTNPPHPGAPDDLAYVMYTSGSTGWPKGVEIPHRAIVRLVIGSSFARFGPDETFLHLAPIAFDASTFEIWGALLHGGRCVVFRAVPSPDALGSALKRHKVTTLWLTGSLFNLVMDEAPEALSEVQQLLIGGEALSAPHVERALVQLPRTTIINGYGPTESTTFACTYRIRGTLPPFAPSIPIGRPIANTETFILDAHLQPVPIGVVGELHIGGDGLARGYLNRPELTAEKFVTWTYGDWAAKRLYRTGDRARYLAGGNIEFLGRLDGQVKIRGFRIELGEIEATLTRHPGVREAAVVLKEQASGDKRLVAYLLAAAAPPADDLRAFLKETLPDHMVPSVFVAVDAWPLSPNGKVDRRALTALDVRQAEPGEDFIACSTELETRLGEIWQRVLEVARVGATDNFFELGGHSLLALRLTTEIERVLGYPVPLPAFLQRPTVRELAQRISHEQDSRTPVWQSLLPLRPKGSRPPFFWVHGQKSDPLLPRYLHPEQPVYGLRHQAQDGQPARHTSVEAIASHYLDEVRAVWPHGPYYIGGYCFGGVVAYEMAQQLKKQGASVDALVMLSPSTPGSMGEPQNGGNVRIEHGWWQDRYPEHQKALKELTLAGRAGYIVGLAKRAAYWSWVLSRSRQKRLVEKAAARVYLALGVRLPVLLRSSYILDVYRRALHAYSPTSYPGSALMFTGRHEVPSGWRTLPTQGAQIHVVEGEHEAILDEPLIGHWANHVRTLLDGASNVESAAPSGLEGARNRHE